MTEKVSISAENNRKITKKEMKLTKQRFLRVFDVNKNDRLKVGDLYE